MSISIPTCKSCGKPFSDAANGILIVGSDLYHHGCYSYQSAPVIKEPEMTDNAKLENTLRSAVNEYFVKQEEGKEEK